MRPAARPLLRAPHAPHAIRPVRRVSSRPKTGMTDKLAMDLHGRTRGGATPAAALLRASRCCRRPSPSPFICQADRAPPSAASARSCTAAGSAGASRGKTPSIEFSSSDRELPALPLLPAQIFPWPLRVLPPKPVFCFLSFVPPRPKQSCLSRSRHFPRPTAALFSQARALRLFSAPPLKAVRCENSQR